MSNPTEPGNDMPQYPQYPQFPASQNYPPSPPPYGWNPIPPPQPTERNQMGVMIVAGVSIALNIVFLALLILRSSPFTKVFALHPTATIAITVLPSPTATTLPATAPFPTAGLGTSTFQDNAPYCNGQTNWSTDKNNVAPVQCQNGKTEIVVSNAEKYNQSVFFLYNFSPTYSTFVTVQPGASSCGGIHVLGNGLNSLGGFICDTGDWYVNWFDSTGSPKFVAHGLVTVSSEYTLTMKVEPQDVRFYIDNVAENIYSVNTASNATNDIGLVCYDYTPSNSGTEAKSTVTYSNFNYIAQ